MDTLRWNHLLQVTREDDLDGVVERWDVGAEATLYAGSSRVVTCPATGACSERSCMSVHMGAHR